MTCDDAFSRNVASLAEPEGRVAVLVHPLAVALVQQGQVDVGEVVHVKIFYRVVLKTM